MEQRELKTLLDAVAQGVVSPDEACERLEEIHSRQAGFQNLGYAHPDVDRVRRQGVAEVIYGEGKTADQIKGIAEALIKTGQARVLITRLGAHKASSLANRFPQFTYYPEASLAVIGELPEPDGKGVIAVASAGTSDMSVAEEAALTAEFLGNIVTRCYDVGVAGIHRLLAYADVLQQARVVIAVAGFEGALASVIGGLVASPVIAVPTSVGYGASCKGFAALLAMLNSCASGVSVVNIDNGFGGAYQASLINHLS